MKRRVALTTARLELQIALGRLKRPEEGWSSFFTPRDWNKLKIHNTKVKELLVDGAYGLNKAVHNIPPDEVVGSIVSIPPSQERSAWEEFFLVAYKIHTDFFEEEVNRAQLVITTLE